jgi:histidinol-phosphate phosphatase family protein
VLFPEAAEVIKCLNRQGFKVVVITNQSGIGRGYFDEAVLSSIHDKMKSELARSGAHVDGVYYCPHHPDDNCACRKPKPDLVFQAAKDLNIDLKNSFVVGDLEKDMAMGKAAGCRTIFIGTSSNGIAPDAVVADLAAVAATISGWGKRAGKTEKSFSR